MTLVSNQPAASRDDAFLRGAATVEGVQPQSWQAASSAFREALQLGQGYCWLFSDKFVFSPICRTVVGSAGDTIFASHQIVRIRLIRRNKAYIL